MSRYLSVRELAIALQLSEDRVRRLAVRGLLPGVRVGELGVWRFRAEDVEAALRGLGDGPAVGIAAAAAPGIRI